ncbi:MAG: glycosyltransferase family 2 protein, partial [Gemmatimonadetes bacterium]|nr:glycosyltransferase family 2 protein [Gemmatimonadota bacterium]
MDSPPAIAVVIPACDEEEAIGKVLQDIPDIAQQIIVVDNGSADRTAEVARCLGACVVIDPRRGYGQACLTGMAHLDCPDIVVFLDGDYSDYPEDMLAIVRPIIADGADMVIGSRVLGQREKGALLPQARFGNWLATFLIRLLFGVTFTDLGPFRALRYDALMRLEMQDRNFGWTAEMQVKA